MIVLLALAGVALFPDCSYAWGPMTHLYLGNEIFLYSSLLPASVLAIIRKYRHDFIYGSIMADAIIGKKFLPDDRCSHSWDFAFKLLDEAATGPRKAFMYGYLCHLAADTVAHGTFTGEMRSVEHTWEELKADSLIRKAYWLQFFSISRAVKRRGDRLLEGNLESFLFSFKTNKRIFKSIIFLSFLNKRRKRGIDEGQIARLHTESIVRMIAVLENGRESSVVRRSPL